MRYKIEFDLPVSNTVLEHIDSTYAFWEVLTCSGYARVIPVDAERKTGKAIVKSTGYRGYWACDQCGTEIKCTDNYCRHCGADLRGKQE